MQYHNGLLGRIDHIFLFNVWGEQHIFAIVTPMELTGELDEILNLQTMDEQEDDPITIGITAIEPIKPYVVPIRGQHVLVDWDIKWL